MRLEWKTFTTAKAGNRPDENEDACFPTGTLRQECKEFRCAVSDGATSTSFSKNWAGLLAETFAKDFGSLHSQPKSMLPTCQRMWSQHVGSLDLPWHALEKSRQGAFATLLWFKAGQSGYSNKTLGRWQALAVGDSCFVQLRDGKLQASFPVLSAAELTNNPYLLSSIEARNEAVWKNDLIRKGQGAFEGGDEFLFMTDAVAGWFLKASEEGYHPFEDLRDLLRDDRDGARKYEAFIQRLRRAGTIKNDDSTLGYLKIQREETHVQEKGWN